MAQAPNLDPKYDDYDFPTVAAVPKSGHAGHTTPEQDAQIAQLRMMLEAEGYTERLDTLTMLRFLRARKFNVELTKKMFIDCEQWRKSFPPNDLGKEFNGVDDLVQRFEYTEKPQVFEYYPQYYHKIDKDGRPVYIEQLGKIDLTAINKITSSDRMLSNLVVEYEKVADPRLPACSRKAGALLETCCTIMDAKGVGLGKAPSVMGYLQQASGISQNYYPERLGKLYIINAPWGFSTVWSVIKRFLDPVTVEKISILGSGYQSELLAQVPAENLPKEFGGQCECEGGCQWSDAGPWQDPQWAKPAKWEQKKKSEGAAAPADSTIVDQPSLDGSSNIPAAAGKPVPANPEDAAGATAPAPAPAAA